MTTVSIAHSNDVCHQTLLTHTHIHAHFHCTLLSTQHTKVAYSSENDKGVFVCVCMCVVKYRSSTHLNVYVLLLLLLYDLCVKQQGGDDDRNTRTLHSRPTCLDPNSTYGVHTRSMCQTKNKNTHTIFLHFYCYSFGWDICKTNKKKRRHVGNTNPFLFFIFPSLERIETFF